MLDIATIRKYENLGWNYTPYHSLPIMENGMSGSSSKWLRVLCLNDTSMPRVYTGQYTSNGKWRVQGAGRRVRGRYLPCTIILDTKDIDFWRYLSQEEINNLFIQYRRK